ncbi:dehydrogenase/reductase SDR family member 13-like [Macrobrachium rosenbergii]|uniref:dehydrogenase/reductase SDR family member 13-like n=1 Tax=Macrobrachium rosenbergii TaxID=79674 RepID=UPI0034D5258A
MILTSIHHITNFVTSLLKYKSLNSGTACRCQNRVRGKVIILTGGTSGIGYYTALDLAKKGSLLYLACRSDEKGRETVKDLRTLTGNKEIHYLHLDLSRLSTIGNFVTAFEDREKRLDVLINNAGIFHHPSHLTEDGIEITYQTNFLGVYMLTSKLKHILKNTPSSHAVFVSSEAHRLVSTEDVKNFDCTKVEELKEFSDHVKLYGISKLAVHMYADHLSKEVPGVSVILVNPGNVWTNIYQNCWVSWRDLLTRIKCALYMRHPEEGAQSTIHAVNFPGGTRCYITDTLNKEALRGDDATSDCVSEQH